MIQVGVLGATGYTGVELVRLLIGHPEIQLKVLTAERFAGQKFSEVFPAFAGRCDLTLAKAKAKEVARQTTVLFSCLPHETAMQHVPELLDLGCKVIDLSADFRFDSKVTYEKFYTEHKAPQLLKEKVYGLPELYRDRIRSAFLVANPGCYPTAALLSLIPLLKNKLIVPQSVICDAKSGTSGAGRNPKQSNVFSEVNESVAAYAIASHRHTPEIEQELTKLAGEPIAIRFTPHLMPMDRGILATTYAKPLRKFSAEELTEIYRAFYQSEPFVRILRPSQALSTKQVRGTNYCDLSLYYDDRTELIVICAVIDNLTKGAAGQALQNMNLMQGFDETMGLTQTALVP